MDWLIACPNCYRDQSWTGELEGMGCRTCGHEIPVKPMARALVHLFSTAAFDGVHGTLADEEGDELLQWIVGRVWGDAMRVGRHDWVNAGCPVMIDDFSAGIQALGGAAFDSLGRLLSAGTQPDVLVRSSEKIAAAAAGRLSVIVSAGAEPLEEMGPIAMRERLYDILSRFPSERGVAVLEQLQTIYPTMDGDAERRIGAALAEALERCRGVRDRSDVGWRRAPVTSIRGRRTTSPQLRA